MLIYLIHEEYLLSDEHYYMYLSQLLELNVYLYYLTNTTVGTSYVWFNTTTCFGLLSLKTGGIKLQNNYNNYSENRMKVQRLLLLLLCPLTVCR